MTFASAQDLQDRFGLDELRLVADRDSDGVPDAEVIAAALEDADSEIVALIAGAASIDAGNVPRNLVRIACNIARYYLYQAAPTEDVRQRYEDAVKFLGLVRKGEAGLDGGTAAPTIIAPSPKAAATEPGSRIFRRGL
jgi:phage gp36-like protein